MVTWVLSYPPRMRITYWCSVWMTTTPQTANYTPNTTQHMTTMLREQHASQLRIFREVIGVEQTLRQQIITAIEPQYLEAFWDTVTSWINLSVHNLIWNLYQLYGRVIPQKLQEQEDCIRQMVCDPVNPIDGIFTAIDELMHYANACGCAIYIHKHKPSTWGTYF